MLGQVFGSPSPDPPEFAHSTANFDSQRPRHDLKTIACVRRHLNQAAKVIGEIPAPDAILFGDGQILTILTIGALPFVLYVFEELILSITTLSIDAGFEPW